MFNTLASYLLGAMSSATPAPAEEIFPPEEASARLTDEEEDWVLVDHCRRRSSSTCSLHGGSSTGDLSGRASSEESIPAIVAAADAASRVPTQPRTTCSSRSASCSSLPTCCSMDESWFVTPPPCFTSTGPIIMETSPLENLLIEHPSMSVYHQHSSVSRSHEDDMVVIPPGMSIPSVVVPIPPPRQRQRPRPVVAVPVQAAPAAPAERAAVAAAARRTPVETLRQQQERYSGTVKNAQKMQIQKACQSLKKSYLERSNKAREVNFRNRRPRRGERSQGALRSNANNNRKCC